MGDWAAAAGVDQQFDQQYFDFVRLQKEGRRKFQSPPEVELRPGPLLASLFGTEQARPFAIERPFLISWRRAREELVLRNLSPMRWSEGEGPRRFFAMATNGASFYQLDILNEYFQHNKVQVPEYVDDGQRFLTVDLSCDRPIEIRSNFKSKKQRRHLQFKIFDSTRNAQRLSLILRDPSTQCLMKMHDPFSDQHFVLKLVPERVQYPELSRFSDRYEICSLPKAIEASPVESFALTAKYNSMTCPLQIDEMEILDAPEEGIQAKVEALLGRRLEPSFLSNQNPFAPLDMSQAPRLEAIYISYLVFKADFSGHVMARLLKFHADRGTPVRIVISQSMVRKKDLVLLQGLADSNSNIKVLSYKYESQEALSMTETVQELHRSMHVKIFATICHTSPKCNLVIFGGRNIHDGFLFEKRPDYRWSPRMVHYGEDEAFTFWEDLEVLVRSREMTQKAIQHFYSFFLHDQETHTVRSQNYNVVSRTPLDQSYLSDDKMMVRHLISLPYSDERALEDFYVEMLDSARQSIRLVSPYFRPTQRIVSALLRAAKRNVDVILITRIDLVGDTAYGIMTDVNKLGINAHLGRIRIFESTVPNNILHTKLVVIDDRLTFLGSVNLNKRSFYHDSENGFLVYSRPFAEKMNALYGRYIENKSREITEKQKIAWWNFPIIEMFDTAF